MRTALKVGFVAIVAFIAVLDQAGAPVLAQASSNTIEFRGNGVSGNTWDIPMHSEDSYIVVTATDNGVGTNRSLYYYEISVAQNIPANPIAYFISDQTGRIPKNAGRIGSSYCDSPPSGHSNVTPSGTYSRNEVPPRKRTIIFGLAACRPGAVTFTVEYLTQKTAGNFDDLHTAATATLTVNVQIPGGTPESMSISDGSTLSVGVGSAGSTTLNVHYHTANQDAASWGAAEVTSSSALSVVPSSAGPCGTARETITSQSKKAHALGWDVSITIPFYACRVGQYTMRVRFGHGTSASAAALDVPSNLSTRFTVIVASVSSTSATRTITNLGDTLTEGAQDDFNVLIGSAAAGTYRVSISLSQNGSPSSLAGYCNSSRTGQSAQFTVASTTDTNSIDFTLYGCYPGIVTLSVQLEVLDSNLLFVNAGAPVKKDVSIAAAATPTVSPQGIRSETAGHGTVGVVVGGLQPRLSYTVIIELPPGLGFDARTCVDRRRQFTITASQTFTSSLAAFYTCTASDDLTVRFSLFRTGASTVVVNFNTTSSVSIVQQLDSSSPILGNPTTFDIIRSFAYSNILESDDILFITHYNVVFASTPTVPASSSVFFTYNQSGARVWASLPYVFHANGYGQGISATYMSRGQVDLYGIEFGASGGLSINISGNPVYFGSPPIDSLNLTWGATSNTPQYIETDIRSLSRTLESAWDDGGDLLTGGTFTGRGEEFWAGAIPRLREMVPGLFPVVIETRGILEPQPQGNSYEDEVGGTFRGTAFENSFSALSDETNIPEFAIQLLLVGGLGLGAAVWSVARGGSGLIAMPVVALVLLGGATLGIVPMPLVLIMGLLGAIITAFIIWGKRAG